MDAIGIDMGVTALGCGPNAARKINGIGLIKMGDWITQLTPFENTKADKLSKGGLRVATL